MPVDAFQNMSDAPILSVWTRWLTFNGVGLMGLGLQLAVLATLLRVGRLGDMTATLLAVEAAILHNFAWHQRWTWRDRPTGSVRATLARLARFHLLNGSVSLAGSVACVWLLAGLAGLDPILANVIAVGGCSAINFFGSDGLVFAPGRRHAPAAVTALAVLVALSGAPLHAAADGPALQPATLAAWQAYERRVDARYARAAADVFFAADAYARPASWRQDTIAGATPMFQLRSPAPGDPVPDVPDGRIHHWVGAIFVPGRTVADVVRYLEAHAGQESGAYDDVIASRLLERDGDRVRVYMKLRRTKVITATYDTEHAVEYRRLGPRQASSRSVATRIAELADAGTPREHEKAAGSDSGYLWRLNAYWRYEQTDGGVLIECESLSLSRDIPTLLRPFVSGVVEGVARESLEKTLASLRRALTTSSVAG
jgi:putative flippase GtrA